MADRTKEVGKTKDAGWQIGVSKTVPYPIDQVWALLTSTKGVAIWLGAVAELETTKGAPYRTSAGVVGEVRSFLPYDRIRLTWRGHDWDHDTTVQVATVGKDDTTLLRFHQERLAGPEERKRQRVHWQTVMDAVMTALKSSAV